MLYSRPFAHVGADLTQYFLDSQCIHAIDLGQIYARQAVQGWSQVKGGRVLVTIRDTGCGIPQEVKPSLFKPFCGNKGGRHSGVGLYIARELLTRYGASFQYSSQKGETIFEVSFPIKSDENR